MGLFLAAVCPRILDILAAYHAIKISVTFGGSCVYVYIKEIVCGIIYILECTLLKMNTILWNLNSKRPVPNMGVNWHITEK